MDNPSLRVETQKNYYVEVLRPSSRYSTFRTKKSPQGFVLRYGKKKGSSRWELQAILHPKSLRSKRQVQAKAKKRKVNPLRNNPTSSDKKRIARIYKEFHITEPTEVIEVDASEAPENAPDVMGIIGTLHGIAYHVEDPNSEKVGDPWYHEFDEIAPGKFRKNPKKPLLCYDRHGRLWIVGGKYKITGRGIVG